MVAYALSDRLWSTGRLTGRRDLRTLQSLFSLIGFANGRSLSERRPACPVWRILKHWNWINFSKNSKLQSFGKAGRFRLSLVGPLHFSPAGFESGALIGCAKSDAPNWWPIKWPAKAFICISNSSDSKLNTKFTLFVSLISLCNWTLCRKKSSTRQNVPDSGDRSL